MADTALENAEARRADLTKKVAELQRELAATSQLLAEVEAFVEQWHRFASGEGENQNTRENLTPQPATPRPVNPPREKVGDAVEKLLREFGRPATRKRLFAALEGEGIRIQGKDPEMVFSTMLWRMQDRFQRVRGRGYWLAGVPVPDETPYADLLG